MANSNEQIMVVDERRLPIMIDNKVLTDKRTDSIDIAVYSFLLYIEPEYPSDDVINKVAERLSITDKQVRESISVLDEVLGGLFE